MHLALAPPGLTRFARYPTAPARVALPGSADAMLPARDGSRFGFHGEVEIATERTAAGRLVSAGLPGLDRLVGDAARAAAPALGAPNPRDRTAPTLVRAFEARLSDELGRRGARLVALKLDGLDYLEASAGDVPVTPGVKVLVVGLDGADWEIADPLIAAGRMPNLARLVREGTRAKLLTITPVLSPVVWTSIATGVEPARHGILDFLVTDRSGASQPVSSRERRVPTLWEMLSDRGVPVGVTGWWATWPATPLDGYMVTDRVAYQLFGYRSDPRDAAGKTWPPERYDLVRRLLVAPDAIPWDEVASYLDGPRRRPEAFDADERQRLDELRTLLASGRTYLELALALRRERPVRFEAVYFEGTDTVGHLFMPFRPPRLAGVDARAFEAFHDVVDRYYETADRLLGRLLEGRDDWTVLVLSDHGFASDATRPLTTDSRIGHGAAADWHRRFGILAMRGPRVRQGQTIEEASIYDVAPTVLALFGQPIPKSWPGRVLAEAFAPDLFASAPVRFRSTDPVRPAVAEAPPVAGPEAEELREKLQSLGYLGAESTSPMTTTNNRGVALLAAERFEEAAAEFRRAIAAQPDQPTLWVNLGIALKHAGHRAEARDLFEKALGAPDARRAAGHQLGQMLFESGDLAGAERVFRRVLEREPGAAEVRTALGLVLEKRGDARGAAREYEKAAADDPNAAEPRNNLGNLAKGERRLDAAETHYRQAIEADPYFMGAYNNLALLYQERGDVKRAIDLYGQALAKAPTNAVVLNNLGSLYYATGDYKEARALWERAVAADPRYASPVNNLAGLAIADGQLDAAIRLLDQALAIDPSYGDARTNRALILRRQGRGDEARAELARAIKDPRAEGSARLQLGFMDLEEGKVREGVRELESAHRLVGDRTDLLNALGEAYATLGAAESARVAWSRSLQIEPAQPRIKEMLNLLNKRQ